MLLRAAITAAQLVVLSTIVGAGKAPAGHEFKAPTAGDVRSPCPGLNSLANHGFIPRNGKGISLPIVTKGLKDGLNVGADFATSIGGLALMSSPGLAATTFNLNYIDEHNFPIEHDGSISRWDAYFGNDYSFNQTIFNQLLSFYEGMTTATIPVASKGRYHRIKVDRAQNPDFTYGPRELTLSYGETALYLSTMGNPVTGDAPISYIKSLFEKEELPYSLGWKPSTAETNLATLGAMIAALGAANPEIIPEGLTLGEGSYRDVLELRNPITGKLENATCILANDC